MKLPEKQNSKKEKVKKKPISKEKKGQVLIVAQEIKFARLLSGNEKKTRDRVLKTLKKWLLNCFNKKYEFKENDFIRIWKGLFYAMWMSDKPLVQEELCESIAEILDHFPVEHLKDAMLMTKAGFHILAKEWYGIDQHRMDKFLMLVRRYLRGSLRCLRRASWSVDSCKQFTDILSASDGILAVEVPQYARNATSMILHFLDCYLEEISKVCEGNIPSSSVQQLVSPLCTLLVQGPPSLVCAARRCLCSLIKQSETGIEYTERTKAWESMGCPEGGPEALELEEGDEELDEENDSEDTPTALDPRAGRVNVSLSPLPVPAAGICEIIDKLLRTASPKAQARARITAQRFKQLSKQHYPYKISPTPVEPVPGSTDLALAAHNLRRLEKTLLASSDELALRGLSRKHRKRLLSKTRSGISIVDDPELQPPNTQQNGEWQVESTEPPVKKPKQSEQKKNKRQKKNKKNGETIQQTNNKPIQDSVKQHKNKETKKQVVDKKTKTVETKESAIKNKVSVESVKVNGDAKKVQTKKVNLKKREIHDKKKQNSVPTTNNIQKQVDKVHETPKKVKFVLKNNGMQGTMDYYKSVRQSPNIPFDGRKQPSKTNLKVSTPSPINPFFKKKMRKL